MEGTAGVADRHTPEADRVRVAETAGTRAVIQAEVAAAVQAVEAEAIAAEAGEEAAAGVPAVATLVVAADIPAVAAEEAAAAGAENSRAVACARLKRVQVAEKIMRLCLRAEPPLSPSFHPQSVRKRSRTLGPVPTCRAILSGSKISLHSVCQRNTA